MTTTDACVGQLLAAVNCPRPNHERVAKLEWQITSAIIDMRVYAGRKPGNVQAVCNRLADGWAAALETAKRIMEAKNANR